MLDGQSTISYASSGPGALIGKYRLTGKLGVGGMGIVFSAEHQRLGRRVAVKLLKPEYGGDSSQAKRFQAEARLVSRLGHPNIVEVYDFGQLPDGSLYYVMELMEGKTLRTRLAEGPLSDEEIPAVFFPLISAVHMAHGIGVVHRDLKPDNVMLLPTPLAHAPRVKLMDFGIAKIKGENATSLATESGVIMGTPAYMAPEQVRSSARVDQRADIYAIGVLLYEALCGERPFRGSLPELLAAQLFDNPPPPSEVAAQRALLRQQVDWPRMDAVVLRAMHKDVEQRHADCGVLLAELRAAMNDARISGYIPTLDRETLTLARDRVLAAIEPPWWQRYALIAAAIFAVGVAVGVAMLYMHLRRPSPPIAAKGKGSPPAEDALSRAKRRLDDAVRGGPVERRALLLAIAATRSREQRDAVLLAMSDPQPAVWRAAVQAALAIAQPPDSELQTALQGIASRATGVASIEVAMARLRAGETAAAEPLRVAVSSPLLDAETRLRAATALAESGKLEPELLRSLIAKAAQGSTLRPAVYRGALAELLRKGDAETQRRLTSALRSNKAPLRREAAEVLARAGQSEGRDELHSAARAAATADRLELGALLAELGDRRAIELLVPFFTDPSPLVRQRAVGAMGALASPRSQLVAPLVEDPDPQVGITAAVALLVRPSPAERRP